MKSEVSLSEGSGLTHDGDDMTPSECLLMAKASTFCGICLDLRATVVSRDLGERRFIGLSSLIEDGKLWP